MSVQIEKQPKMIVGSLAADREDLHQIVAAACASAEELASGVLSDEEGLSDEVLRGMIRVSLFQSQMAVLKQIREGEAELLLLQALEFFLLHNVEKILGRVRERRQAECQATVH